nr:hypothetical protein [Tanacetum cinerariifolium]
MDRSVSRDEIRVAVWNCGEIKSLGPDGYTFEFFRRYWRFIGSDFCSVVECFFQSRSLWYRVIQALYGASFELHHVNQSLIWCSILRDMQVLISKGFDFVSHYKKRVGDGHNTQFWYDYWVFDQPLRVRFPRLFAFDTDKESTVASKLGSSSNGDGVFRVKEFRTILDDIFLPFATDATRRVKYISIKINVFGLRAQLDRLPTRSNLVCRGVVLAPGVGIAFDKAPVAIPAIIFSMNPDSIVSPFSPIASFAASVSVIL